MRTVLSWAIVKVYTVTSLCYFFSLQPKKLGFSNLTHLRRRRPDESTDYVCPVESSSPQAGQSAVNGVQVRPYAGFRGLSPILDRESDRSRDQVGLEDSRADPSPWQRWQQHDILCCHAFPSANQLSLLLLCFLCLRPIIPQPFPFPAPLNPAHQPDPVPYKWRDSETPR